MTPELRTITSERELANANPGDFMKVGINHDHCLKRMVYEGVVDGRDAFMEIDLGDNGELPRILSWNSERKYLQFSDEEVPPFRKGVIFNHLYRNLGTYTPTSHPDTYLDKLKMIQHWENKI